MNNYTSQKAHNLTKQQQPTTTTSNLYDMCIACRQKIPDKRRKSLLFGKVIFGKELTPGPKEE